MNGVYDVDTSPVRVQGLLQQVGPVEFTDISDAQGKRFKALALFTDEDDARKAVVSLHDKAQHSLNGCKLFLQQMSSSKCKATRRLYQAIEDQIAAHVPEWREKHIHLRTYHDADSEKRFVMLKVEGLSVKDVVQAADTLDCILSGRTIEVENSPFWNPALQTKGVALQTLEEIENEHGVLIVRNQQKRRLQFFGRATAYNQVRDTVVERLTPGVSVTHIYPLSDREFLWACREGFKLITASLGAEAVSFDVVSSPKRLVVIGSTDVYRQLVFMISRKDQADIPTTDDERGVRDLLDSC